MIEMRSASGCEPVVSAVIVHDGDSDAVYACVESMARLSSVDFPLEVILVESARHELVRPRVRPGIVRVHSQGGDRGYAAAANEAAGCARGRLLLFLDPAVRVEKDDLESMTSALLEDRCLAALSPALERSERRVLRAVRFPWSRRMLPGVEGSARVKANMRFVRGVPRASLLVRHDVFRALAGFDDAFDGPGAARDWCLRAGRRGYRIGRLASVTVARIQRQRRSDAARRRAVRARLRILRRHGTAPVALLYGTAAPLYVMLSAAWEHVLRSRVAVRLRSLGGVSWHLRPARPRAARPVSVRR